MYRSFGAKNFQTFWQYWNPIFGYYLGKKVYKPLKQFMPASLALLATFLICGLFHDAVTFLVRGQTYFLFGIWFLLMGVAVLVSRGLVQDFSGRPWFFKAMANLVLIAGCYLLATQLKGYLALSISV